ncbi:MAG: hypothetical protein ACI9PP_001904 [Halobacteriales archaeon]|jgi:hypothetical protein
MELRVTPGQPDEALPYNGTVSVNSLVVEPPCSRYGGHPNRSNGWLHSLQ